MATGTQQNLVDAIYSKLAADTNAGGVSTLTSARIYSVEAPLNDDYPKIVFSITSDPVQRYFSGPQDCETEIEIKHSGWKMDGGKAVRAVADRCFSLLDGQSVTTTNWSGVQCLCEDRGQEQSDDSVLVITQRYKLLGTSD